MGITIHVQGRLRDPKSIPALAEEVAEHARKLGWEHEIVLDAPLKGVIVNPHKECDTLILLFDRKGVMRNPVFEEDEPEGDFTFCKTQHAPPEIHVAVCELLKRIERHFAEMKVHDEGEYWQTGDRRRLEENLRRNGAAIDAFGKAHDEMAERAALDRVNGPQPPYEEPDAWDFDEWLEFWRRWDEHRCPMLAAMRGKTATLEALEGSREEERRIREQREADERIVQRRMRRHLEKGMDPELYAELKAAEAEAAAEAEEEPWKESVPAYRPAEAHDAVQRESPAFACAYEWFLRFEKATRSLDRPVVRYLVAAIMPALVGTDMAWDFREEDDMRLAMPSRLLINAERFEHVARMLRADPALKLDALADEALEIAKALRGEAGQ